MMSRKNNFFKRKSGFRKEQKTIVIYCEGETEKIYFEDMKRTERLLTIKLEPKLPSRSGSPTELLKSAIKEAKEQKRLIDKIWCVYDLDVLSTSIIDKYKSVLNKAKKHNIGIASSSPCFELWFLLHYKLTEPTNLSCKNVEKRLKLHIPDFNKQQQYLKKKKLYTFLYDKLKNAITNAKKTNNKCLVYKIIEEIKDL